MGVGDPCFTIGQVPIYGDLILSPMAGYTDLPFRLICRELGSAMSYTSCILDDAVIHGSRTTDMLAEFSPAERPIAVQLLSKDEELLARAARQVEELGPDLIDLNMGCPARHVSWRGRGAALLCDPAKIERLVSRLVREVSLPVTAKIRLGWDDSSRNYLQVAHILEDNGIAAIAVHGRTKAQGYSGRADWEAIAEVKCSVHVPVLANGDVRTVADIEAIRCVTGCDGVLFGRGAVGNPWIFQRRDAVDVPWGERLSMIKRHLSAMANYYGEMIGVRLFRKHVVKYVQELEGAAALRPQLMVCETAAALLDVLDAWAPGRARAQSTGIARE
jgi:tRNA-dihydrouridine synthase B